ncbi:beta-2 adrenergic receptor [Hydra vulgaris]|uniref:beta-2 adrenergic receptor n=1 Tax=Hydra vulgaris TaxID=6087 RepID=UPI001F5F215B|nr:beta-2 adrenergic receptor [Hydra vulgaris]
MNNSYRNDSEDILSTSITILIVDSFLFLAISVVATFGNIVVFICYYKFRTLQTVTNVFILSLSASDLLVALFSIPLSFLLFVFNKYEKNLYYVGDMIPSILSIYSLALVAVNRALAITKPYFHEKMVTKKSATFSVVGTWSMMLSYSLIGMNSDKKSFTLSVVLATYVIPVVIMILSYTAMGFVAKRHAKELKKLDKTITRFRTDQASLIKEKPASSLEVEFFKVVATKSDSISISSSINSKANQHLINSNTKLRHLKREFKAALTLSLILSCFIITWTPFMSLNMVHLANIKVSQILVKYFKILHYANSAFNPVLYVVLNQKWRKAFAKILCFRKVKVYSHSSLVFSRSGFKTSSTKSSIGW